jgi:hypothetical protein
LGLEDRNLYDRKELSEETIEITLYASNVLDSQRMIYSKFYSNQTHKQTNASCLQHQKDMTKSKATSLAFLVVNEDFRCHCRRHHLSFLHLNLLIVLPKSFVNRQPIRIGSQRIGLKARRVLNKKINHWSKSQSNNLPQLPHKPIINLGHLIILDSW